MLEDMADVYPIAVQVPELNVQNGVLKALSFLFEYIGEMGKDYIYAVSPLLEDALMDRDLVSFPLPMLNACILIVAPSFDSAGVLLSRIKTVTPRLQDSSSNLPEQSVQC